MPKSDQHTLFFVQPMQDITICQVKTVIEIPEDVKTALPHSQPEVPVLFAVQIKYEDGSLQAFMEQEDKYIGVLALDEKLKSCVQEIIVSKLAKVTG